MIPPYIRKKIISYSMESSQSENTTQQSEGDIKKTPKRPNNLKLSALNEDDFDDDEPEQEKKSEIHIMDGDDLEINPEINPEITPERKKKKIFRCEKCDRNFKSNFTHQRHMGSMKHKGINPRAEAIKQKKEKEEEVKRLRDELNNMKEQMETLKSSKKFTNDDIIDISENVSVKVLNQLASMMPKKEYKPQSKTQPQIPPRSMSRSDMFKNISL